MIHKKTIFCILGNIAGLCNGLYCWIVLHRRVLQLVHCAIQQWSIARILQLATLRGFAIGHIAGFRNLPHCRVLRSATLLGFAICHIAGFCNWPQYGVLQLTPLQDFAMGAIAGLCGITGFRNWSIAGIVQSAHCGECAASWDYTASQGFAIWPHCGIILHRRIVQSGHCGMPRHHRVLQWAIFIKN